MWLKAVSADDTPGASRRRLLPAGGAVLLLLAAVALAAALSAGRAPPRLLSANPVDGASLAAPPATVRLTFSGELRADRTHVTVVDAANGSVLGGAPAIREGRIEVPVSIRDSGTYRVGYHALFESGRQASGLIRFTVVPAGQPADVDAAEQAATGHSHGVQGRVNVALLGASGVLVLISTAVMWGPRRPRPPPPEDRPAGPDRTYA